MVSTYAWTEIYDPHKCVQAVSSKFLVFPTYPTQMLVWIIVLNKLVSLIFQLHCNCYTIRPIPSTEDELKIRQPQRVNFYEIGPKQTEDNVH